MWTSRLIRIIWCDLIERAHSRDEPAILVTFNYDTLLEDALIDFGLEIKEIRDYTKKHPFYRVFKVHGSVNWVRILKNEIQSQNASNYDLVAKEWIRRAPELQLTDEYLWEPALPSAFDRQRRPAFPAIAIPVEKGKSFECPADQIEELKALLPQVSKLLVIGWRAGEQHFLDLLKAHLSAPIHLYVVTGATGEAEDVRSIIVQSHRDGRWTNAEVSGLGFTDFILSGKASTFL